TSLLFDVRHTGRSRSNYPARECTSSEKSGPPGWILRLAANPTRFEYFQSYSKKYRLLPVEQSLGLHLLKLPFGNLPLERSEYVPLPEASASKLDPLFQNVPVPLRNQSNQIPANRLNSVGRSHFLFQDCSCENGFLLSIFQNGSIH